MEFMTNMNMNYIRLKLNKFVFRFSLCTVQLLLLYKGDCFLLSICVFWIRLSTEDMLFVAVLLEVEELFLLFPSLRLRSLDLVEQEHLENTKKYY